MEKYTQVRGGIVIDFGDGIMIDIKKVRKNGTNREFFRPTIGGKNISSTLYARLYDARRIAGLYYQSTEKARMISLSQNTLINN